CAYICGGFVIDRRVKFCKRDHRYGLAALLAGGFEDSHRVDSIVGDRNSAQSIVGEDVVAATVIGDHGVSSTRVTNYDRDERSGEDPDEPYYTKRMGRLHLGSCPHRDRYDSRDGDYRHCRLGLDLDLEKG
ncbi:hypothetical protein LCGC14_2363060, partial [marine sediment metagenome]